MWLVDALAILGCLGRQTKLLVELASQLFELCKSLAEIVIFKVTTGLGILILSIRILIEVDTFEIVEVQVIDIGVGIPFYPATFKC